MRGGRILLYTAGTLFSTVPPLLATLAYIPIWSGRGGFAMLSGLAALMILLCFIPLFRLIRSHLKTPSAPLIWLIVFLTFFILAEIADEMKVIAFIGLIGNLLGAFFFRLAKRDQREKDDEGI